MKSYNHLYEQYLSEDNYRLAVKNATRHKGAKKRKRDKAKWLKAHQEEAMPKLMDYAANFHSDKHTPVMIYDGIRRKQRGIVVPTMREQVVHHMVINVMKPIFMKGMYEHSYGSVPGRGAHKAKGYIEKWISRGGRDMKYCLKMDIRKYFDSVPHDILKAKLARLIHDDRFLRVIYEIIDAMPGDRGIPIGFYTSQWFANFYLTELDHRIKEKLGAKYYVRYMDDMVIFGGNKRQLHQMRKEIEKYLREQLGLEMKSNWQVFLFDYVTPSGKRKGRDLDFMGFRFYRDKTLLRKSLLYKMTRKARRIGKKTVKTVYDCKQMMSYLGWIDSTDTYGLYRQRVKPNICFQYLKRRISAYERKLNREENKHVVSQRERRQPKAHGRGQPEQPQMVLCAQGL